ncbi:MAG: YHS domain-containing (seleno)protein [Planctomycetota bacterium]
MTSRTLKVALACAAFAVAGTAAPAAAQNQPSQPAAQAEKKEPVRTISEWDLPKRGEKLAIGGYDPVAYFPEGGGKAKKGKKNFSHTYKGVTYRFSSQKHMDMFKKAPARYEPAHGTWCSWAMAHGDKTESNPKSFIVKDDRLFLFYDGFWGNTRKDWLKGDHKSLEARADREWKSKSKEDKRQMKVPA